MFSLFKNVLLAIILITVIILLLLLTSLHTESKVSIIPNPVIEVEEILSNELSNEELLWKIGLEKGMSQETLIQIERVINCESSGNSQAIGDFGNSFGLVQIHLISNPEITKEQALDPIFSLNFITDEFIKGHQNKWTCYRMLYDF